MNENCKKVMGRHEKRDEGKRAVLKKRKEMKREKGIRKENERRKE